MAPVRRTLVAICKGEGSSLVAKIAVEDDDDDEGGSSIGPSSCNGAVDVMVVLGSVSWARRRGLSLMVVCL